MLELPGARSRRTRAQTSVHPPAGGRVRYSPRRQLTLSRRHPGDGEQPARAARKEAQGQREARSRRGPEQPTSRSQEGRHGSACPSRDARSCRGPGGTRDDGVAPSGMDQRPSAGEAGASQCAQEERAELPGAPGSLPCFTTIIFVLYPQRLGFPLSRSRSRRAQPHHPHQTLQLVEPLEVDSAHARARACGGPTRRNTEDAGKGRLCGSRSTHYVSSLRQGC